MLYTDDTLRNRQVVLLAALSLAVSIILLSYSAYGWFAISRTVSVSGLELKAYAPRNLEISKTGTDGWTQSVTVDLKKIVKQSNPAFDTENDDFYINPASSYDGFNIWTTTHVLGSGWANDSFPFERAQSVTKNLQTTQYEGFYIDVPLYFRVTDGAITSPLHLKATSAITGGNDVDKVVRVAFLNPEKTANSLGATAPLVYSQDGKNHNIRNAVIAADPTTAASYREPVYLTMAASGIAYNEPLLSVSTTPAQLVMRIWLEGQDSLCDYAIGGETFSLSMEFTDLNG